MFRDSAHLVASNINIFLWDNSLGIYLSIRDIVLEIVLMFDLLDILALSSERPPFVDITELK